MAPRHADRRLGLELPGTAARMAVRLPPGSCRSRRTAGRDERVQVAAASVGERLDPDISQTDARHPAIRSATQDQDRSLFPPLGELQLPADVRVVRADGAVDD